MLNSARHKGSDGGQRHGDAAVALCLAWNAAANQFSLTRIMPAQVKQLFEHYRRPDWATDFD